MFPGEQGVDSHDEIPAGLRLLNVAMRSRSAHIVRDSFRFMHRENQNAAIPGKFGDLRRSLESAHRGHGHVKNHYIGLQPLDRLDGLFSVARFAANFPLRPGAQQHTANSMAYHLMIIDD